MQEYSMHVRIDRDYFRKKSNPIFFTEICGTDRFHQRILKQNGHKFSVPNRI